MSSRARVASKETTLHKIVGLRHSNSEHRLHSKCIMVMDKVFSLRLDSNGRTKYKGRNLLLKPKQGSRSGFNRINLSAESSSKAAVP